MAGKAAQLLACSHDQAQASTRLPALWRGCQAGERERKQLISAILWLFGEWEKGIYWISLHLLGLVIQMLVCTWDTAALWPQGIAAQSRWHPCVPRCWQILCVMALWHTSMKMLSWHVASWWPAAQQPHTDLGLVILQCGRPGWIDAGWCGVAGPREAQGCRVSVDRTCPVAGRALVPAAIVEQDWLVSCAGMGVPGAQTLCTLMQLWACSQLISAIESIPVSFCSSEQDGLCAGDPLWTPMLGMTAESYCCITGCVLPHLLTPLCFGRTRMEPCHP